ncbi:ferredoxin [Patescibacteria group bacterium]|nr:ferredoxin [Patescibacteria group bacterium]
MSHVQPVPEHALPAGDASLSLSAPAAQPSLPASGASTPVKKVLKLSRVEVDRDICIGAAPCVTVAPGVFQLDEENKAYIVDQNGADAETILLAAQACPVQAIFVYDDEGKQIYP